MPPNVLDSNKESPKLNYAAKPAQTVKLGKVTLIPVSSLENVVARHRTYHVE